MANKRDRNGWCRSRVCASCGKVQSVRKDNMALSCKDCSSRASLAICHAKPRPRRLIACAFCFGCCPPQQRYCSRACRTSASLAYRSCWRCRVAFPVRRSNLSGKTNSSGHFCSRGCYHSWLCRTERITGRGSRWTAEREEAIRRNPFCAICGTRHHLQVHHIIPFRLSRDNGQDNLIPLCPPHHRLVELEFLKTEEVCDENALAMWRSILMDRQAVTRLMLLRIIHEKAA